MATNDRLTAFNINSIDMKIMSGLRRIRTPVTPTVNKIALTIKYADNGINLLMCWINPHSTLRLAAQNQCSQERHNNEQACHFKGKGETVEQCQAECFDIPLRVYRVREAASSSYCAAIDGGARTEQAADCPYKNTTYDPRNPTLPADTILQFWITRVAGEHSDHEEEQDHDCACI